MRGLSGGALLRRPVRVRGIELGRTVELIFDASSTRLVGFEVLCGDGGHRFLPFAAAEIDADQIAVRSSLTLLERNELAFYRDHGTTLSALRADDVADVEIGERGAVERVLRARSPAA